MNLYLSHKNPGFDANNDRYDLELWELVRQDDKKAFADIYKKYVKVLYQYGMKICHNEVITEDNIHDLFIDLWRKRKHLEITGSLKYYFISSYRRRLFKILIKDKKQIPDSLYNFEFKCESAEDVLIKQNTGDALKTKIQLALQQLTKRQREAIYLKFFQNMSYHEIADIMEISIDSVYVLVSKSIKSLKQILPYLLVILSYVI